MLRFPSVKRLEETTGKMAGNDGRNVALLQRAGHGVNHAARQKIDGGFAAELVAGAALDQA
jgi:hypothetical protein